MPPDPKSLFLSFVLSTLTTFIGRAFQVLPWGSGMTLVSLTTGVFAGFGPGLAHWCWWAVVPPDPKPGFLSFVWCTLTIFVGDALQVLEWMSVDVFHQ